MVRTITGIKGLDPLIEGGFERGTLILVSGGAGTGKTIFALQFLYYGIIDEKENGLYITFEESEDDLVRDAKVFGWDIERLQHEKKLIIKYYSPFEIEKLFDELEKIILDNDIKRVVIDSASGFGLYLKSDYDVRRKIHELSRILKYLGCTGIVISEIVGQSQSSEIMLEGVSRFGVEEFTCDGVIILHYAGLGGAYDRSLQILKMRRTNHARGIFPMRITKNGIEVGSKSI